MDPEVIRRFVEERIRLLQARGRREDYGNVATVDTETRTVTVYVKGLSQATPGFYYGTERPKVADRVRIVIDPTTGDRYVDGIYGRDNPGPWVNLPLPVGFIADATIPQYRLTSFGVQLQGIIAKADGTGIASGTVLMVLPEAIWPTEIKKVVAASQLSTAQLSRLGIDTNGTVTTYAIYSPTWVSLDGIQYGLSV